MSDKKRILIQLDSDPHASAFDRVVAVDAGAQQIFPYANVTLDQVEALVHGAIFTRGPADLKNTAIFIGGSNVTIGEQMLEKVTKTFLGPLKVSVMLDANGANTTAAAAVLRAGKHIDLASTNALVLGGTGPVGQRAARLLAGEGATVALASRSAERAADAAAQINAVVGRNAVTGISVTDDASLASALNNIELVIAAGAAGITLLPSYALKQATSVKVAIDLNAVPPLGIEGVEVFDKAKDIDGVIAYGAIGVGGTKMKIHKAALASLFESNDKVLDAEAIYQLGKSL